MVMEISVEFLKTQDLNYSYDDYTVYIEDHRILTIVTDCEWTASKWMKDVLKSYRTKDGNVLVGLSVERERLKFTKSGVPDSPYDLLELCVGSHCLLYHLPDPYEYVSPKFLDHFFSNSRVVVAGIDMENLAEKLYRDHEFKVKNPMDLRTMAIERLGRDDLDLGRYDLDRLAKAVLGKHMDVVRPEKKVSWFDERNYYHYYYPPALNSEKVKYATVDPYLCFLIGSELLEMTDSSSSSSSCKNKNKKKNKKKT